MKKFYLVIFFLFISQIIFTEQFKDFYFLGDSLSDIGNNPNCDSSIGSTKQPNSRNWTQFLAEKYGLIVIKSDAGGNNFAYGGAESGYNSEEATAYDTHRGARTQVNQLLARNKNLNSRAVYSLYVGGNDIIGCLVEITGKTEAQVISECGPNITASLKNIHDAGARIILLGNLPDMSNTPLFFDTGEMSDTAKRMSTEYNETVRNNVNNIGFDVIQIDLYSLFNDVLNNKTTFGFLYGPEAGAILHPGDNYDNYVFWDVVHPTQAAYKIMADYYYSILQAPYYFSSLTEIPYKIAIARNDIIRQRLLQRSTCEKKLYIFIDADPVDTFGNKYNHHKNTTLGMTVGSIYRFNKPFSIGAGFSYSPNKQSIDNNTFKYDLNDYAILLFADYRQNLFYLNTTTGWSYLQYRNIARQITLGPVTESTFANTNGYQYFVGISGGAWFPTFAGVKTGPTINSTYQYISVDGYSENGQKNYLKMVFKNQHTNTLDAGIGWSFYLKKPITSKNTFIMNANVLANKQFLDNERNIHFHLQSIINSHGAVPTRIPTDYYTSVNVSMAYLFAGFMSASLGYNGYFGKDRYKNNVITLSVGICCF